MSETCPQFLIVDDDDIDAEALRRGIRKRRMPNAILRAVDGEEALHMLRGTGGYERVRGPVIVTLDLNMPRMNGFETLTAIRQDPDLSPTVVFVVSTSDDEQDRRKAYNHHPAGYVVKSNHGQHYSDIADLLAKYSKVVALPQ